MIDPGIMGPADLAFHERIVAVETRLDKVEQRLDGVDRKLDTVISVLQEHTEMLKSLSLK